MSEQMRTKTLMAMAAAAAMSASAGGDVPDVVGTPSMRRRGSKYSPNACSGDGAAARRLRAMQRRKKAGAAI